MRRGRTCTLLALPCVALLGGCGSRNVLLPGPTAATVARLVSTQTGFHPTDVRCPSGVDAKVGKQFTCTFTGPDGSYVADLRVQAVHGKRVDYFISTHRR